MNNFKNFIITVLSLIILIESAFLIYFISYRQRLRPKERFSVYRQEKTKKITPEVKPVVKPHIAAGKIALVLDDWGYTLKNRYFITDNNFHVTLSILPFKTHSALIAQLAHSKNKDVIVHMPMEPHNKENYGLEENTLLTNMDKKTVVRLLDTAFQTVPYAEGLSNHMGSKATEDAKLMGAVLEYLMARGFFFLDSLVTSHSVCRGIAEKIKIGFTQRDIFIDNESDPLYIREQVRKLTERARHSGVAVGIGHDRPATVAVLTDMIPHLEQEGFQFVNLSEVISSESQ